jgi:hypothetical protein
MFFFVSIDTVIMNLYPVLKKADRQAGMAGASCAAKKDEQRTNATKREKERSQLHLTCYCK